VYSSDPRCKLDGVITRVEDRKDRTQNWELLMKNVNSFYQVTYDPPCHCAEWYAEYMWMCHWQRL